MRNEFLHWSKRDLRVLILLLALAFSTSYYNLTYRRQLAYERYAIPPDTLKKYMALIHNWESEAHIDSSYRSIVPEKILPARSLKKVEINKAKEKDWMGLGFTAKQAKVILHYREAKGAFNSLEEFYECYVISDKDRKRIKSYIYIDVIEPVLTIEAIDEKEEELLLDLNSADSLQLLSLKGIGPYYAGKIVSYRSALGGYNAKEQLLELWNFDSLQLEEMDPHIYIGEGIQKIDLNFVDFEGLRSHPYISYKLARLILAYRDQHGPFNDAEDLKKIYLMNDSVFTRLRPYLRIE